MQLDPSVFRAYDIRGIGNKTITPEFMKNLGRAFVAVFDATEVVVGYDARPSSKEFLPHFLAGITEQGANVRLVGLVPSELVIGTAGLNQVKNSAIITASHNPAEWVGIKLYKDVSIQIGLDAGQLDIKAMMESENYSTPASKGEVKEFDPWPGYVELIKSLLTLPSLDRRRVLVDAGNGTGGAIMKHMAEVFNLDVDPLFFEPDGTYPNHVPNPIVPYFRHDAEAKARTGNYELSILFDGDADRVVFLDEHGELVPTDIIGTLLVDEVMRKKYPGCDGATDLRRGWTLKNSAEEHGYKAITAKSGNPFLKRAMREHDVPFGFEASAHNIYKEYFFSESSSLTIGYLLTLLQESGKKLSELIAGYRARIAMIEEINYEHHDVQAVFDAMGKHFTEGNVTKVDGLSIDYPDWHLNIRSSNTEPLIRLNLEAKNSELLQQKFEVVNQIIEQTGGVQVRH